jgi:hypothetical protein
MREQNPALISTNILTLHDRPIKLPLNKWTQIVSDRFISFKETADNSPSEYIKIANCFNLAALIEAYTGRIENATQLCHAQLLWLFRISETTDSLEALVSSFQPWINLGRIDYNQRRYEQALKKFRLLFDANNSVDIYIEPITICKNKWEEIKRVHPETKVVIDNVFIVDSLKAMLRGKDYTKILEFYDNYISSVSLFLKEYLTEAKIISLGMIGEKNEAMRIADKQVVFCLDQNKLAFMMRQIETLIALENFYKAKQMIQQLYLVIKRLNIDKNPNIHKLGYGMRVAEVLYLLEKKELAHEIVEAGYYGATLLDDEPLKVNFLEFLVSIETDENKLNIWKQNLYDLLNNTCYWFLKKKKAENDYSKNSNCSTSLYQQLIKFSENKNTYKSLSNIKFNLVT